MMTKNEYRKDFNRMGGDVAFETAKDVLSLLADFLREHEPYATNSIKAIDDAYGEIPETVGELLDE